MCPQVAWRPEVWERLYRYKSQIATSSRPRRAQNWLGINHYLSEVNPMGSVIKKRRKRMSKKKHRKLLRKTRHQRRNKK